jgi:ankyrin repeat protein
VPPLYWAAYNDKREEMDLLLEAGAQIDAPAPKNRFLEGAVLPPGARLTALSIAVEGCHHEAAERLLHRGASKAVVLTNGKSLVEGACSVDNETGQRDRMRALLTH